MPRQAPRIDRRIVRAIPVLDDPSVPIAETCRRVGSFAERIGVVRPSYEQIRVLVHDARRREEERRRSLERAVDVYLNLRSPRILFEA
jgi:hypothetical protein